MQGYSAMVAVKGVSVKQELDSCGDLVFGERREVKGVEGIYIVAFDVNSKKVWQCGWLFFAIFSSLYVLKGRLEKMQCDPVGFGDNNRDVSIVA